MLAFAGEEAPVIDEVNCWFPPPLSVIVPGVTGATVSGLSVIVALPIVLLLAWRVAFTVTV
jgi:hypothetical protein